MTEAIRIRGLGKRYRIGERHERSQTLAASLAAAVRRPLTNLRRLRRLGRFDEASDDVLWALADVDLDVEQGEVLAIIGRNGAGKSTLLKILARITSPTTGSVRLRGRVASLLEVGTGFHQELTGRENIYLNGTILGMSKSEVERKLEEIIEFSGVERFIDTPLKRFSSGMAVRLAFSVAAHLEPEILLIDEVLAVGDAEFRKKCLGKMRSVSERGRTVLFVSHNMAAVNQLCRRAVWLDGGRLERDGATDAVVAAYLSTSSPESGERSWPDDPTAPGDDGVRLLAIRTSSDGEPSASLDIRRPIDIEIDYRVLEEIHNLRVGFHLLSDLGATLLCSGDQTAESLTAAVRRPGVYTSRCRIPARLLNASRYSLTCILDVPFTRAIVREESALTFDVEPTAKADGIYPEKSPGLIDPQLEWSVALQDRRRDRLETPRETR